MSCRIRILYLVIVNVCIASTVLSIRNNNNTASEANSFVLACGASSDATDSNGRKWIPDAKFLKTTEITVSSTAQTQDPALPSSVPYMTARIFKSESTYSFSISPKKRHWIRLHFYPESYNDFDLSNSFFSVTANNFILLRNFSASITAEALTQAYIMREYAVVPMKSGALNLTFTPSSEYKGSFAFVNGIEVISMPEIFKTAPLVGFSNQPMDIGFTTMQTMIRLNVGGRYIPENDDSELTRTWYDDSPYLYGAAFGVTTTAAHKNVSVEYPSNVPKYIAPRDVYGTARSMGPNDRVNRNFNLTWVFQVDTNFTYLVRFHFCDFQMSKVHQRVFGIFINNQTANPTADVIAWSGGQGVPVYKDYAIHVRDGSGDDQLWVDLEPNVAVQSEFYDVILNGLEIFKVNDTKGNLAGPNPVPTPRPTEIEPNRSFSSSTSKNHGVIVGAVVGLIGGMGLVVGLILLVQYRKRMAGGGLGKKGGWLPIYASSRSSGAGATSSNGSGITTSSGGLCRHFSLTEIKLGTENFSESKVIGVGGFGKVYKGIIDGGIEVAIKRANPSSQQGVREFQTEIELLSKLRHHHLVSLIGACDENGEMILVYDYMANGTFREHLYNSDNEPLSWKQRLDICIGAARGLHYLHTGAKHTIIHRDVKTTNILLDGKWVAKVSDFGLSRTGPSVHQTHVSTVVKGSFGYLDPEYFRRQQLTEKSDVYSFGVVLFEALCARPAIVPNFPKEQVSLADWALQCTRMGIIQDIVDPLINEEITPECLKHFAETAVKCLSDHSVDRPAMESVLWNLEYALQLQNNPDGPKVVAEQKANHAYAMHKTSLSMKEDEHTDRDSVAVEL